MKTFQELFKSGYKITAHSFDGADFVTSFLTKNQYGYFNHKLNKYIIEKRNNN